MLTDKQVNGTKFEIWIEQALRQLGYFCVRRDIHYYRNYDAYRQVDDEYRYIEDNRIKLAIVEAKYSSGTKIPYLLRTGPRQKNGHNGKIDNLPDETLERKRFVKADLAILATNYFFEEKVKRAAKSKDGFLVIERPQLTVIHQQVGGKGSLEESIKSVNLTHYDLQKNIEILHT